jgi:acetyl-CoA C-acetyltransferase
MYVTGVGRTKFGALDKSLPELMYEAIFNSIDDCDLKVEDLDAVYVANFLSGPLVGQLHLNSLVSHLLPEFRKPCIRIETACASGGSAFYQALLSLSKFENIMVVGVEKMTSSNPKETTRALAMAGDSALDYKEGLVFPASYALVAQQHMMRYNTTHDDLSLVSLKNHKNANLNPLAHFFQQEVDLETIKKSKIVCSPLNVFDCCPISDGAAAVIVSRNKRTNRDIEVIGSALAVDSLSLSQREDIISFEAVKIAARDAYEQSKVSPKDLDIAEVHDCFTIAELVAMEDLGICKPGESKDWIREGKTELNGDLPINTDGGLIGDGHPIGASGIAQIIEVVAQLRGEAGKRQVNGARIGLTHNVGGVGGTAAIHIFRG